MEVLVYSTHYRCFADNLLELLQVLYCVDLILVCEVLNLNQECSGQVQAVPQGFYRLGSGIVFSQANSKV